MPTLSSDRTAWRAYQNNRSIVALAEIQSRHHDTLEATRKLERETLRYERHSFALASGTTVLLGTDGADGEQIHVSHDNGLNFELISLTHPLFPRVPPSGFHLALSGDGRYVSAWFSQDADSTWRVYDLKARQWTCLVFDELALQSEPYWSSSQVYFVRRTAGAVQSSYTVFSWSPDQNVPSAIVSLEASGAQNVHLTVDTDRSLLCVTFDFGSTKRSLLLMTYSFKSKTVVTTRSISYEGFSAEPIGLFRGRLVYSVAESAGGDGFTSALVAVDPTNGVKPVERLREPELIRCIGTIKDGRLLASRVLSGVEEAVVLSLADGSLTNMNLGSGHCYSGRQGPLVFLRQPFAPGATYLVDLTTVGARRIHTEKTKFELSAIVTEYHEIQVGDGSIATVAVSFNPSLRRSGGNPTLVSLGNRFGANTDFNESLIHFVSLGGVYAEPLLSSRMANLVSDYHRTPPHELNLTSVASTLIEIVGRLIELGVAAEDRIGLIGTTDAATLLSWAMISSPQTFRCAVFANGCYDIRGFYKTVGLSPDASGVAGPIESPLQAVRPDMYLPAVLLLSAVKYPQFKKAMEPEFADALQQSQRGDLPIFFREMSDFRIDLGAGHWPDDVVLFLARYLLSDAEPSQSPTLVPESRGDGERLIWRPTITALARIMLPSITESAVAKARSEILRVRKLYGMDDRLFAEVWCAFQCYFSKETALRMHPPKYSRERHPEVQFITQEVLLVLDHQIYGDISSEVSFSVAESILKALGVKKDDERLFFDNLLLLSTFELLTGPVVERYVPCVGPLFSNTRYEGSDSSTLPWCTVVLDGDILRGHLAERDEMLRSKDPTGETLN